ncbi:MAG: hypothetical protein GY886_09805, partial [Gammaproteobacteria bacterium]|nr:hypothetical protein [Gammaproteobacteria bacterium]
NGDLSTNIGATISATTSGTLINNFFTADLIFSTNGGNSTATERMRIDSSGNVGIGTGSPGRLLTVSDSGGTLLSLVSTDDDNCQILFGDSVSDTVGKIVYAHGDNHMRLETNGAEAMRIASDGNVGIGETSPSFPLEVNGGTGDGIKIKAGNTANDDSFLVANSSDTALFKVDGAGNVGINTTSPDGTFHVKDAIAQVYIQSNDGQPSQVVFGDVSDASGGMIEYTSSNEMAFKTNNLNERMRIASNGWVNPNANTTSNPADSQGLHFGWNLSNGGGESLIVFNQGAGATGGLVFSDNSANGTPVER